ncbi:MAG: hypothetical protein WA160_16025 [Pseudobdellovibrio sp.]
MSIDENIETIKKICKFAVEKFNKDMDEYWCGYEGGNSNFPTERNIVLHLASSFSDKENNFHIYGEVGTNNKRMDLIALSPLNSNGGFMVLTEAKRLNRTQQYLEIIKDIKKIEEFRIEKATPENLNPAYKNVDAYGLVLAMLCDDNKEKCEKYKDYWVGEIHAKEGTLHADLMNHFGNKPVTWGEQIFGSRSQENDSIGKYSENSTFGYILFFLFKRKPLRSS